MPYTAKNITRAGWRIGFVAFKSDGTRVYGDMNSATYNDASRTIAFDCPAGCSYVWLVVSAAPTTYWTHNFTGWIDNTEEQWPYRVKFYQTNVYGETNNNSLPTSISDMAGTQKAANGNNVYELQDGLPRGIYIAGGRKVLKKD